MRDICGDQTTVWYGALVGGMGAQSNLICQELPGHDGMHEVVRWFGDVRMIANWF